jgi:hypothetical protein
MARPKIPVITEASIMTSFEKSKNWVEVKESSDINSDMVKPIPPSRAVPKICGHLTPLGSWASRNSQAKQANRKIPSGFPITNPNKTPWVTGFPNACMTFMPLNTKPEFTRANKGNTK